MKFQITYEVMTKKYTFQDSFIAAATSIRGEENINSSLIRFLQSLTADGATPEDAKANLIKKIDKVLELA